MDENLFRFSMATEWLVHARKNVLPAKNAAFRQNYERIFIRFSLAFNLSLIRLNRLLFNDSRFGYSSSRLTPGVNAMEMLFER